jgi:hypothetical protein
MEEILYTPAVHTKKYKSYYSLLTGEKVIDIKEIKETVHRLPVNCGIDCQKILDTYCVFSYCIFFTNFGRIFESKKNMEETQIQEYRLFGNSSMCNHSFEWLYEANKLKVISTNEERYKEFYDAAGIQSKEEPIQILTEEICSKKITNTKSKKEKELTIEKEKKYTDLLSRFDNIYKEYFTNENDILISMESKIKKIFVKIKELFELENEYNDSLDELEDWRAYKRVKSQFYRS